MCLLYHCKKRHASSTFLLFKPPKPISSAGQVRWRYIPNSFRLIIIVNACFDYFVLLFFIVNLCSVVLKVELRKTKREWKYNMISSTKFFVLGLRDNYFRDKEVSWESVDCTAFCTKSSPFKNVRKIYFLKIRSLFSDRLARFLVDLWPSAAGKFHYYDSSKLVLFSGQIILDE